MQKNVKGFRTIFTENCFRIRVTNSIYTRRKCSAYLILANLFEFIYIRFKIGVSRSTLVIDDNIMWEVSKNILYFVYYS